MHQYRSGRGFCSKNNETEGGSQIQSIFFRVGTTFRVGLRRLGHRFGLHAHPHTGKQLSPVAGFAGGPSTARSDGNDNDDDNDRDDDDEGVHGLTSPTVADVRRRARQSTCHATPGSFELIARGLLSRLHLIVFRHHRARRFHHTPVFWSVSSRFSFSSLHLLTPAPPALFLTPFLLALYWLRHLAWNETRRDASGTVPMHLVSFSLESSRWSFASHGNNSWEVTEKEVVMLLGSFFPPSPDQGTAFFFSKCKGSINKSYECVFIRIEAV